MEKACFCFSGALSPKICCFSNNQESGLQSEEIWVTVPFLTSKNSGVLFLNQLVSSLGQLLFFLFFAALCTMGLTPC